MIEIVPMTSADVAEARVLWARTEGIALHEADSPEALTGYLQRNPGCSFVAREGRQLAGVALAGHDGRRGYLHHVAVAPAFRKQGIGRNLVERCLSALREQGILKCHLFVLSDNAEGMKFWASLGWRQRDLLMMSLTLSHPDKAQMKRIVNGLLVLDKPTGITSRDAVDRVLEWFPRRTKIGHTGTLDPLATGVLVICLGSATRLADYVQAMDKVYRTKIILGAGSDTDDADGTITPVLPSAVAISEENIREALAEFVGVIAQKPPAYSAVKIDGKRAHDLARRGREVEIASRPVHIYAITILHYAWPELDLEIHCGKGTYIRSLARDLGEKLGCGAYVQELRRTRVGPFTAEQGITLDDTPSAIEAKLLPPRTAIAHLAIVEADAISIDRLQHGQPMTTPPSCRETAGIEVAIIDECGVLVGVGCVNDKGEIWPVKVFLVKP